MVRSRATVVDNTTLTCLTGARPAGDNTNLEYQVYINFNGGTSNVISNYFALENTEISTFTIQYQKCPAGYYRTFYYQNCTECQRGSYSTVEGSVVCTDCASGTYQELTGQQSCDTCPADSTTQEEFDYGALYSASLSAQLAPDKPQLFAGATHLENCTCSPGSFYDTSKVCSLNGRAYTNPCCSQCDEGAV